MSDVKVLLTQIRIIDRKDPSDWLDPLPDDLERIRRSIKAHKELGAKLQYEIRELIDRSDYDALAQQLAASQAQVQEVYDSLETACQLRDEYRARYEALEQPHAEAVRLLYHISGDYGGETGKQISDCLAKHSEKENG